MLDLNTVIFYVIRTAFFAKQGCQKRRLCVHCLRPKLSPLVPCQHLLAKVIVSRCLPYVARMRMCGKSEQGDSQNFKIHPELDFYKHELLFGVCLAYDISYRISSYHLIFLACCKLEELHIRGIHCLMHDKLNSWVLVWLQTKNISGRFLVGLRWWNEVTDDGSNWRFETLTEVSSIG